MLEAKNIISRRTLWHSTFGSSHSASSACQRFRRKSNQDINIPFLHIQFFSIRHTQIHINNFTSNLIGPKNNLTMAFNLVMPPKIAYLALEIIVAAFPSLSPLFCMSLDILIRLPSELDSKHKPQSTTHLKQLRYHSILEFQSDLMNSVHSFQT